MKTAHQRGGARPSGRSLSAESGLLEREVEFEAVAAMIDLSSAKGQLLVIEGPPGIGKTSLLVEARALAREAGLEVLSARGSELELEFSHGVVRQLFEPCLGRLPEEEHAEVLAGAASLASPLFDPVQLRAEPAMDTSLATLHGLYWLTANVAARRPLLLAIDDLHSCDAGSLRWLAYLVARMEDLPLALVAAVRSAEPGTDPLVLGQLVSDPLATLVLPAPLTGAATGRLVRQLLSPDADDDFCVTCHEQSGGNPLLLRELLSAVASEGLTPTAANVERLRELGADAVSRTVGLRLIRLSPDAARLARGVAILGDDADPRNAAAIADLDEERASQAATELARSDILRPGAPLAFVHPVVGNAICSMLTAVEQEQGHARAARLLTESGAEPERVAAHVLRAAPTADAGVVRTLRDAARSALARGAAGSAVTYLRRALEEPPFGTERAEVLLERQLLYVQDTTASFEVFRRGLEELGPADPRLGGLLEAGFINRAMMDSTLYDVAVERLERIRSRPADTTVGEKTQLALLAYHDARANVPPDVAVALARRALADGELMRADNGSGPFIDATIVLTMADLDEALEIYDQSLAEAYRQGSLFALAAAKIFRAQVLLYRGELTEAEAEIREGADPREAWGGMAVAPGWVTAYLADALIEQGNLDGAGAVLTDASPSAEVLPAGHSHWFYESKARFRMLSGDVAQGVADMIAAGRRFEAVGGWNPAFMAWRSHAAVGLLQLGDREEARRLAGEELELARVWGAPRALGRALRAAGLVEGGEKGLRLLREAVEVLDGSPARLELAKALTELGVALRRGNRRAEARDVLRRAVELATHCAATPLGQQAETELLATGARPRRIALSGVDALTPSERRVAEMAAEGDTNREIAQALFVTPKTVEVHLSSVYRKLGIRSRSQLPAALAEPASARR